MLLVVCRVNHEVALGVLADWAKFRSILTDNNMSAV